MEIQKQLTLLSALSGNRDLMALTAGLLKPSFFDPALKKSVKFILEYFAKYRDVPKTSIIRAETGVQLEDLGTISTAEIKYVSEEIEKFCQYQAALEAVMGGPDFIQKGDYSGLIKSLKDATSIGLQKDLGLDYFADPLARLEQTLNNQARISTGWAELDEALGGGLARQELITFLANSGGGKSMTMLNLCRNLLEQGYNGVYITLEMAEGVVSKRLDSMISKVAQSELLKDMHKVADSISKAGKKYGQFKIKRFAEGRTTIMDVRAWLQQLEQATGFRPDFICIDYIDIMGTTAAIKLDNMFTKDKYVTEEIRGLGFDYNAIMISAAQLGRCVTTDTKVILKSGEEIEIQNTKVGDLIKTIGGFNTILSKTNITKKPCYKITLEDGSALSMTAEHKMPIYDKSGAMICEKSLDSGLVVGDLINTVNSTKLSSSKHETENIESTRKGWIKSIRNLSFPTWCKGWF